MGTLSVQAFHSELIVQLNLFFFDFAKWII
ncbi:hypothetical protein GHNINEIG_00783 [Hydrogenovibrio crunogenus]|uniref:Uncharacterized protein n=1 Tax=Hydrogenovibrio crunogenus TaxID=39765 RepID=A0A4P7NYC0_9GAMM|nr:hypothetical protein GHNINEIG_00783 [Hydrogenovibrio crunogenus]